MSFQDAGRAGGRPAAGGGPHQAAAKEVFQMSTGLTGLRRMVDLLGGPKDTVELRQRAAELKGKVAGHAKSATVALKELGAVGGDRAAVAKLVADFEGVLGDFQRLQRVMADKCTHHKPRNPQAASAAHAAAVMQEGEAGGRREQEEATALLEREANKQELIELDNMVDYNQVGACWTTRWTGRGNRAHAPSAVPPPSAPPSTNRLLRPMPAPAPAKGRPRGNMGKCMERL